MPAPPKKTLSEFSKVRFSKPTYKHELHFFTSIMTYSKKNQENNSIYAEKYLEVNLTKSGRKM
jgi:hypothetical protein